MDDKRKLPDMSHYPKCRRMRRWHKWNLIIRTASVAAAGYFNIFHLAFMEDMTLLWGTILTYAVILVMAGLAIMHRPVMTYSVIILLILGMLLKMVNPFLGALPACLYVWHILEFRQAAWLREQVGYPQFSERLTEQDLDRAMEASACGSSAHEYAEHDRISDITPPAESLIHRMQSGNLEMPSLEEIGLEEN